MKKKLSHIWHAGGIIEYDSSTGSGIRIAREGVTSTDLATGCFRKLYRRIYAWHKDKGEWVLQAGNRSWELSGNSETKIYDFFFFRNFKVVRNGRVELSVWYKTPFILAPLLDPTHDALDAESDDFFLMVHHAFQSHRGKA